MVLLGNLAYDACSYRMGLKRRIVRWPKNAHRDKYHRYISHSSSSITSTEEKEVLVPRLSRREGDESTDLLILHLSSCYVNN